MRDYLPSGLLGLLLASFLAAYMSTISTQLNWGASYIVNDFYRRFYHGTGEEKYYVLVSRITTIIIVLLSLFVTSKLDRISDAWIFILECSAGIGLVLILRWFWWRINAWSEISAMIAPLIIYPFIKTMVEFPYTLFFIVGWSTFIWIIVTFLTPPTDEKILLSFYERIHPGGILWAPIAKKLPHVQGDSDYLHLVIDWIAGCVLVFFSLFGVGKLILGEHIEGFVLLIGAGILGYVIFRHLSTISWKKVI